MPRDDGPGESVEEEVVAGRDDDEQHEQRVEHADEEAHGASAAVAEQAGTDDERLADVHARDGGVGVVERADEARVEVDVAARDGVDDPDPAQPWWGGREDEIADEGKSAREQECGAAR